MRNSKEGLSVLHSGTVMEVLRAFRIVTCKQCWALVKESFSEWSNDKVPRLGAALAFYTALSLAPLLVVVLATAGLFYGQEALQGQLVWQFQSLVGREGAKLIQGIIAGAAHRPTTGIIATVLGLMTLLFGASSAFVELQDALNTIWHVSVDSRRSGLASIFTMIKVRAL